MLPSWSNTAFIPVSKNTNEEFLNGIYNYVNSVKDESCAAEAKRIFGDNLIDPSNQNAAGLQIGAASIARAGFDGDPVGFFKAQGWEIPTGYTSSLELTRQAGLRIMQQSSSLYAKNQKVVEQFRKDQRETLNTMPEMLTDSLYRAGAIGSDALLKTDAKMKPEDLERISKYYDKEEAVQSYRRARNAWAAFSYFMRDVDSLQSVNREQLAKIADFLKDKDGSPDRMATATLALLVDRRAKDMQTDNPEAWQLFVDHLQNWGARGEDQQKKDAALEWNKRNAELVKIDPIAAKWEDIRYGNETVENLYAMLQGALNTSMSPSEKASWYEHAMADVSRIAGESVVPTLAGLVAASLLKGAGASAFTAGAGSYLTNYSLNVNSTINAAVADAYRTGKINPEAYGRIEGQAQAAVEGLVDMGTTYKGFQYLAGKGANKIASLSSGSRYLTNKYARTVISYLGAGALEGAGELFEEELGGALSASLNALARSTGVEMSANQYSFGEALGDMQSHEIAAVFAYTYALGLFGIPADYKRAKVFASNTDNLRAAGLSTSGVRRVQEAFLDTELKISAINQNDSLSPEQKKEQIDKVEEDFGIVQKLVIQTDVWDASPEEVRQRLKKAGKKVLDKAELATILQHEIDLRLMRKAGIIGAEPSAPDTYTVTFIQEGEKKEDGTKGESKIITQEWSRNQLTNWLQIEKADLLEANLRKFQSLVKAHAAAQEITIDGLKIEFQNMRDIPLGAYESLQKHNALTEDFFAELSSIARNMIIDLQNNGMTAQEAAQQPSGIFKGVSLGEAAALDTAAAERKEQASQTSEGESKGITTDTSVSFPAMNIRRADGSYLIAYVAGDTNINDMLEDMLETHIKHQLTTGQITRNQLAGFLKEVDSHLPGKSILPKNKTDYSMSDLVEAYSSLAMAHYLYNEQYLPLTQGGHQLMRNIGRVVDTARVFKTLGDSWFTYANSEEGKAYLADSGKDLMSIMQEAGFTFGNILAQARATAQHEQDVREALNYQPDIEQEVKALMDSAQQEQQLADLNQQEAKEPITIPADQSITGKEITIEPESSEQETLVSPDDAPESHLRNLIQQGKAKTQDFARFFRDYPNVTEAQATEQGIRPLTQKGNPTAAYTQGRLIAAKLTPQQFNDYINGKLKAKDLKKILTPPKVEQPIESTPKQEQPTAQEQTQEAALEDAEKNVPRTTPEELQDAGRHIAAHKDFARKLADSLSHELPEDIDQISIPKYFPIPDYEKLINNGTDQRAVALICYLRNCLPDKPRGWRSKGHRGEKWRKIFDTHREIARALIAGELDSDAVIARLDEYHNMGMSEWNKTRDWTHNVYAALGWPVCANIPKDVRVHYGQVWTRDKGNITAYSVISGKHRLDYVAETLPEIMVYLRLKYSGDSQQTNTQNKPKAKSKLAIYSHTQQSGITYHVGASVPGGVHVKLSQDFKTSKEARAYLSDNVDALEEKYKQVKKEPELREAVSNKTRIGKDHRQGKNVDNETFMRTFGINGITYGNWVAGAARQAKLNATYDAFMDLSEVLGIPPRAISLNGSLGIQFGAAGRKGSSAHYRAADIAINLNRDTGDGSLAHEWWHALDNYFMRQGGKPHDFASSAAKDTARIIDGKVTNISQYMEANGFMNERAAQAFHQLIKEVRYSNYKTRSSRMTSMGGAKYWASEIELTARLFETYVREKIKETGRNDFLANFQTLETFESADAAYKDASGKSRYPYPTAEEMQKFTPLLDNFFASLTHTPQEDGNVVTFSIKAKQDLTFTSDKTLKASDVKQSLTRLAGQELICLNSPIVATVNSRQRGKLVSPAARDKSVANGFTQQQHLTLASRVDDLYKYAIPLGEYNDKNGRANLRAVFRFAVPVQIDDKTAFALLTLKRVDKDNLYSLELEEINQLGGTLDRLKHLLKEEPSTIPLRAAEDIVAELASKVKEYFGENALPPITAEQAESSDLFIDGVLEAQNAIVTQPDVNFSIKALHASPTIFYKFSTEFMGSGEGTQAFGWGLYFATNTSINKSYYNLFKRNSVYTPLLFDGKVADNKGIIAALSSQLELLDKKHGTNNAKYETTKILDEDYYLSAGWEKAIENEESYIASYEERLSRNYFGYSEHGLKLERLRLDIIKLLSEHDIKRGEETHSATNYRVELNVDDSNLLLWDKPVSDELFKAVDAETRNSLSIVGLKTARGKSIYETLEGYFESKEEASKWLAAHGYKGIKFLDRASREKGDGTYNYVIFSGDDIKITAVNESGTWSMDEGWEEYTDPTANFSIRAANPSTLDRFTADPLGERIVHTVRTEARRYARVLGDKTPQEQAMNAIASAESIINAVDKYLHRPDKPVSRRHRNQLTKLLSIIEKYAQIIASGTPRSFKRISPAEAAELEAAIAELEAAELDTAETDPALLIEDSDRTTKRTRDARAAELRRRIVREAAKGRVYKVLAAMLDTAADALDDYLKDQLLTKLHRLTATVDIKRTPGKRLKGKMTAPLYRELEQAIQLMAYSTRQKEDAIDTILTAHETLAQAIASNEDNLTRGNTLLIELAHQLEQDGTPVTAQTLTAALAAHEARVAIFADIDSKNYEQTRTAANAIYHIIRYGRALWQQKHDAREAEIQTYLRHFLANTTPESETANAKRNKAESRKWKDALSLDITMNAAQTIMALSSYEALRPLMQDLLANYSTAAVARQKHLQEIRKQELYAFGRIIGITPATQAGYTDKQLKELSDKFDAFYAENNKTVETTITPTRLVRNAAGELEPSTSAPLKLTKWEALNLILTYRQEHYQPNAQEHGFTPEILTQLENFIGQQMMDYGNAIQQILVNDGTIPVYEEREGIPMRDNPLYWPGHININTINTTRDEPLVNPYHPAASHDFLHARVRNRQEVGNRNAFGVFRKAIADRANYVYADPVTDTITSLLARDQFANRLETLIGGSLKRQLQTLINEIKGAAWQETSLQDATSGLISAAFGAKSLAVLSGNPSSLIRQFSAVANAGLMPGISPQKYLAYAIKAKQNQSHISFTDILKLDAFTTRKRDNAYVNEMIAMGADATFSTLMNWAKTGINAMDKLDLYANAFSATVIYNIKYDQLKAQGILSEEQIRKRCEQEVAIYTKLLAQPLNRVDKSALYWMIGHEAIGRAILFMGSEAINKVGMLRANYIMYRNQGNNPAFAAGKILVKMGFTVGLASAVTEAALALLLGRTPDDDDSQLAFYIALWLNASFGQYLSTIPLLGGVTDIVFSPYGGYSGDETVLPGTQLFTRDIGKLHTMLTDDKEYSVQQWNKEINRFMRNFTTILGYAGGANSKWQIYSSFAAFCQSLTAALNAEGFIFNVAANLTGTADEKTRRPKSRIEKWLTPEAYRGEQKRAKRTRKTDKKATTRTKTTKTRERKSE